MFVDVPLTVRLPAAVSTSPTVKGIGPVAVSSFTVWAPRSERVGAVFGAAATFSPNGGLLCARVPLTPLTVSVYAPLGVPPLGVTTSVDEIVAGFVLKFPVAPAGRPVTLSVTGSVKPPVRVIVTA